MNKVLKTISTNFSYALTSNLVTLIISILMVLILPKLIGVSDYGYWQLYLFYISYLGFFNIGWIEGIYLRYGGVEYNRLNRGLFASQFLYFITYISFTAVIISIFSGLYINDVNKKFILIMVSLSLLVTVPRGFLLFVLQATNRIKAYSLITLFDRLSYCLFILGLLIFGVREYKLLIAADFIVKLITLFITIFICKEIVFVKIIRFKENTKEIIVNISVGIKLMFANIASMLIIGIVRFGIERSWDISTFGKVSLTLSISNLMMVFINALGIVLFPILRRTEYKKYSKIYLALRDFLMPLLLGTLVIYFPMKSILSAWLPLYTDSLKYLSLLLPIVIFEGKMALLINTYLKTLREEALMLKINIFIVTISVFITSVNTIILKDLDLTILSIVLLLAFRSYLAEIILARKLEISILKDILLELIITSIFIILAWFNQNIFISLFTYILTFSLYLYLKKVNLVYSIREFNTLFGDSTKN